MPLSPDVAALALAALTVGACLVALVLWALSWSRPRPAAGEPWPPRPGAPAAPPPPDRPCSREPPPSRGTAVEIDGRALAAWVDLPDDEPTVEASCLVCLGPVPDGEGAPLRAEAGLCSAECARAAYGAHAVAEAIREVFAPPEAPALASSDDVAALGEEIRKAAERPKGRPFVVGQD